MAVITAFATMPCMAQNQRLNYPKAKKVNIVDTYFGEKVADPYRWLENDTTQETAAWVKAENKVTNDYLSKIPFRGKLRQRYQALINYERIGAPFKKFGRYYFYRNNGKQNQNVLYVKNSLNDTARVFLNPNELSTDGTVALKGIAFSNDGKYFAYIISRSGSDWQEIYVREVKTGKQLQDHILWNKFSSAAWYKDGFYYSAYDAPDKGKEFSNVNEHQKIYYHKIGTPQSEDKLYYENTEHPKRFYNIGINEEETIMEMEESGEGAGCNLYVKDLSRPDAPFAAMTHNMDYQYSIINELGGTIYLFTNYDAPKGRIMATTIDKPDIKDWQTLVAENTNTLSNASIIGGKLYLTYSKDACDHAYVYSLNGKLQQEIKLPSLGSVSFSGKKEEKECFFSFTSYTIPTSVYKYDVGKNEYTLYSAPKIKFNPNAFVTEQIFYKSKDGTKVPMFLTHKKGMKLDGKNPVLIYGYGGFNISINPGFAIMSIPFMEKGGIYAVANIRGGSEYGEAWHLAGTKMHKQNVFDDFIGAAEYLIAHQYTNKKKIAIMGGSNGGLLVGACMTQRPDLYRVAIAKVGVMDMLRYHKFTIGWNWASDYGTSDDSKEMFDYLKSYSPLHNIRSGVKYPATLVTTADHDDRVVPAHSFKFAATLQECNKTNVPTIIRIDSKAGHGGGKPISKIIEEYADEVSFLMYNLGMKY